MISVKNFSKQQKISKKSPRIVNVKLNRILSETFREFQKRLFTSGVMKIWSGNLSFFWIWLITQTTETVKGCLNLSQLSEIEGWNEARWLKSSFSRENKWKEFKRIQNRTSEKGISAIQEKTLKTNEWILINSKVSVNYYQKGTFHWARRVFPSATGILISLATGFEVSFLSSLFLLGFLFCWSDWEALCERLRESLELLVRPLLEGCLLLSEGEKFDGCWPMSVRWCKNE